MRRRLTQEEFIERSRQIHGHRYDYSSVTYVNMSTKVSIVCPDHGVFLQTPANHMSGKKCFHCAGSKKLTDDAFVQRSKLMHGDFYSYDLVHYVSAHQKVKIVCKNHGVFHQTPVNHLSGKGCISCGRNRTNDARRHDTDEFIEMAQKRHGDLYDYRLTKYVNGKTKISIICKRHGEFSQHPQNHLYGGHCPSCSGKHYNSVKFIDLADELHKGVYKYDLVDYVTSYDNVRIICDLHGEFLQTPSNHLCGRGCPSCAISGYSPSKPGTLYYVRFDLPGLTLWKIGITNLTVKKRFATFAVKPIIIWQKTWDDGGVAAREEKRILKGGLYDQYRYNGEALLESGNTECFTIDIMQLGNVTRIARSAA